MRQSVLHLAVSATLLAASSSACAQSSEARGLEEVRNTVVNLLEALVQKGVMTKEQAEQMVAAAQSKAAADAKTRADSTGDESNAVRVTYVPEIVRQQISEQVSASIKDDVTRQVTAQAQAEGWGVPGALPEWIKGVRVYGDVRARAQSDLFASDNVTGQYVNFLAVNDSGGIDEAGENAFINTSEDRYRMVGRVRLGMTAQLGNSFAADLRLASGNARTAVSTNQTLGNYGGRWSVDVDKAAVLWNPINAARDREIDLRFGRFANPFLVNNELIWDSDLTFEGVSATYALDLFGADPARMERSLFLTVGAFPLQEVELSSDDKWLYAAQLGGELPFGSAHRLRLALAYYDYENITGVRNTVDSNVFDFTAPRFLQKGNTLFDIRSTSDNSGNLFALAGKYRMANATLQLDLGFGNTHVVLGADYVTNLGWDTQDVLERTGFRIDERTDGYEASVTVGRTSITDLWQWRAFVLYRYLERDAVLDAFADSDFHLGGTDAKGYQLGFDLGLARGTWLRLRYLTANEIGGNSMFDSPPLGIDVWQLDLNGQF
ncbi:MAG TPA: putative porin [Steroidobacteraceae bacterium]|nr:putative porin [Steroidobacteraceae bacterium]